MPNLKELGFKVGSFLFVKMVCFQIHDRLNVGNILHNTASPTEHCYRYELCYDVCLYVTIPSRQFLGRSLEGMPHTHESTEIQNKD